MTVRVRYFILGRLAARGRVRRFRWNFFKYMILLSILSAGAAQAVVQQVIADFKRDTGNDVRAAFGAVGAMKARALAGNEGLPVDAIVLTDAMIDELIVSGYAEPPRCNLGKVGTGVAVRAGVAIAVVLVGAAVVDVVVEAPAPFAATRLLSNWLRRSSCWRDW